MCGNSFGFEGNESGGKFNALTDLYKKMSPNDTSLTIHYSE